MFDTVTTTNDFRHLPVETQQFAGSTTQQREKHRRAAAENRDRKATDLAAKARDDVQRLLGKDGWADLQELMRRELLAVRDLLQPPPGLTASLEDLTSARNQKIDAFLLARHVSPDDLAAIGKECHDALTDALSPTGENVTPGFHRPSNLDRWNGLSPSHAHPHRRGAVAAGHRDDPHRWEVFQPPFFFNFGFTAQRSGGFIVDRIITSNTSVGDVGIKVTMDANDADWDHASGDGFSAVAFGFVPPVAGRVEVLIDALCVEPTHRLSTHNHWGSSTSSTGQTNFLMLDVLHPNVPEPSYAEMSTFSKNTAGDHNFHQENLIRGDHYFANLISAGAVPAGQTVTICAGTRSFDSSFARNMRVNSASDFRWFINSVQVRIAP